ncbi:flagellar biosynthesis protein FlhF [Sulfurovum sp. zt1-1]|uniref:Flagellar biosynthesis protein FlhF n=1 Tax=Sulfurovum zhangzhouensis TaxID=3019067 RepID=A0ABT7QYA1_9BACT|nr:flagellar biosynthesis protein FlhF [Sulfurovum zhangzhouensis]MDM5271815.1 flagellar biosynthesis protein FlhF [Sulfurovum zhangzhouensis]
MIHETFVASDPKSAYIQAVEKYGNKIELVSAKQLKYDDGQLRCEIQVAIPEAVYIQKTMGDDTPYEKSEEALLIEEIEALKSQLSQMKETLQHDIIDNDTVISEVKALLKRKGIAEAWLDGMINGLAGSPIAEDNRLLVSYLLEEMDEALKEKPEDLSRQKVMMFVGPTGTGKTTTIAKLAARYAYLMDRPYSVALINLDSYKVGAIEQLEHYADIMQIDHVAVENVHGFKDALDHLDSYDIILVDTAGMSPYDTQKLIRTVEYVNSDALKDLEVNLVLPATVKYEDMEDIFTNFSFLNLDSVIITKFDETKHLGTLLNFMLAYDLPMSYFSIGQEVPDDLRVASKEYLLERFIGDIDAG